MNLKKLVFLLLFASYSLLGCKSFTVHVVAPIDYQKADYNGRARYLAALHEANKKNSDFSKNGSIRKVHFKIYGGK